MKNTSINTIGATVATSEMTAAKATYPLHLEYCASHTDAQRSDIRFEFKNGFVREIFSLNNTFTCSKGADMQALVEGAKRSYKDAAGETQALTWAAFVKVIDAANSKFTYWVVNGGNKGAAVTRDNVVIPEAVLAHLRAIDELVETYPEMRAMCNAYIANAK